MSDMQLRADYGQMDQGSADIGSQAGNVEEYKAQLKAEAGKALGNFGGGVGSDLHQAAMVQVDKLVDEHVQSLQQQKGGLTNATETFQGAGAKMKGILASGA